MAGFSELIPDDLINVFDERELEVSCLKLQFYSTRLKHFYSAAYWRHVGKYACVDVSPHFPLF